MYNATTIAPSIILYTVDLVKKAPNFFQELEFDRTLFFLGEDKIPCHLQAPDLFSFVLGITKPSLAFVNYTKAEHPTMEGKAPLRVRLVNPARDAFVDKTAVGIETSQ